MRISKISTGNKLNNFNKTFGELKEGDIIYWAFSATKDIENTIYTVTTIKGGNKSVTNAWTDLNPKKQEKINCDRMLKLERQNVTDSFYWAVPSNATYFVTDYRVFATSLELLLEVIEKYKIPIFLQ